MKVGLGPFNRWKNYNTERANKQPEDHTASKYDQVSNIAQQAD